MWYHFFFWLHIISYVIWLITSVGSLVYGIKIKVEEKIPTKMNMIRSERLVSNAGNCIAFISILISGIVMSSPNLGPPWGWFDIQLYPWLAVKQLFLFIIMILLVIDIKRSMTLKTVLNQKNRLFREVKDRWIKTYRISLAIYTFVIASTLLGILKPALS
ncbi:hypothetical protein [Fodinibius saliphilus]|uniref:hypothetical protein n=1 Tax=Fodinibius saliphilus TaxID=1920650 RepID=UPI00110972DF|nr:hypothetical protein [Fodinibius saliphilus]